LFRVSHLRWVPHVFSATQKLARVTHLLARPLARARTTTVEIVACYYNT
jgi:hypothetical protein